MDSVERLTTQERIAELERVNAELRSANRRLAHQRLDLAEPASPRGLGRASRRFELRSVLTRVGSVLKVAILNLLPHGLTVLLVRARGSLQDDRRR